MQKGYTYTLQTEQGIHLGRKKEEDMHIARQQSHLPPCSTSTKHVT